MPDDLDPDLQLLEAIAHPTRLAILRRLSTGGPAVASELNGCGDVGQSTVSHHLKVLHEAGWVGTERRGPWIRYSLRADAADQLRRIAEGVRPRSTSTPPRLVVPAQSATAPDERSSPGMNDSWRQW